MTTQVAYKMFTLRRDGSIGPLFIGAKQRIPVGEWLESECIPTDGFKVNSGWHACSEPVAPHLVLEPVGKSRRVWARIEIGGHIKTRQRPTSQGGDWILAERMRVVEVLHGFAGITKSNKPSQDGA
jgi:hypothetical protein